MCVGGGAGCTLVTTAVLEHDETRFVSFLSSTVCTVCKTCETYVATEIFVYPK